MVFKPDHTCTMRGGDSGGYGQQSAPATHARTHYVRQSPIHTGMFRAQLDADREARLAAVRSGKRHKEKKKSTGVRVCVCLKCWSMLGCVYPYCRLMLGVCLPLMLIDARYVSIPNAGQCLVCVCLPLIMVDVCLSLMLVNARMCLSLLPVDAWCVFVCL